MRSLAGIDRRLRQIEKGTTGARIMAAQGGIVPDDYRPEIDTLLVCSIAGGRLDLSWRGQPYDFNPMHTIRIGGGEQ